MTLLGPFVATRRPSYTLRGYLAAGLLFVIVGALGLATAIAQGDDGWSEDEGSL